MDIIYLNAKKPIKIRMVYVNQLINVVWIKKEKNIINSNNNSAQRGVDINENEEKNKEDKNNKYSDNKSIKK